MRRVRLMRAIAALALIGCLAAPRAPALAHAVIVSASPAVNQVVHGSNVAITLRFNSRIDHERSRLTLIRPDGKTTAIKLGTADPPDTLTAIAHDLTPGAYRLRWQVLAVDGHITRGDIPFRTVP